MKQKERPAKENVGMGGENGMLNEREGKASKGECWQGRREWNAEWERRKGQQRRMLVKASVKECWIRQRKASKERRMLVRAGGNGMLTETEEKAWKRKCWQGGNVMLNEREEKACKGECWWGRRERNAEWERRKGK
jgi:hypothetical protein